MISIESDNNQLLRQDIKSIVSSDLDEWGRETALIDGFILFNFIPIMYINQHDLTHEEVEHIKRIYVTRYGSSKLIDKYFKQIHSHLNKYTSILFKMFQIFTLSDERKLTLSEMRDIFNQSPIVNNANHHLTNNNDDKNNYN